MKNAFYIILLFFSYCSVRPIINTDYKSIPDYSQRIEIKPPLELVWRTSIASTPARNFSFYGGNILIPNLTDRLFVLDINKGKIFRRKKIVHPVLGGVIIKKNELFWTSASGKASVFKTTFPKPLKILRAKYKGSFVRPLVIEHQVLIPSYDNVVRSFSREDLSLQWEKDLESPVHQETAVDSSHILILTDNGQIHCIDCKTGKISYQKVLSGIPSSGILLENGKAYFGTHNSLVICLDTRTGEIIWISKLQGRVSTTPLNLNGEILVGDCANTLTWLDKKSGAIKDTVHTNAPVSTNFVRSGDYIYWGDLSHNINCLELSEKIKVWSYKLRGCARTNPAIYNGLLFIGSEDKYVYAFGPEGVK